MWARRGRRRRTATYWCITWGTREPEWAGLGVSRPIRSDEWWVVTPLTQATINNISAVQQTSLYREDLRINYGMPMHDWGLAFKPTLWLYGG